MLVEVLIIAHGWLDGKRPASIKVKLTTSSIRHSQDAHQHVNLCTLLTFGQTPSRKAKARRNNMKNYTVWTGSTVYHVTAKTRFDAIVAAAAHDGAINPLLSAKSGYWHARPAKDTEESTLILI